MTFSPAHSGAHPVLAAVAVIGEALGGVREVDPGWMSVDDKAVVLESLVRQQAQLDALLMRVMAGSSDLAEQVGARRVGDWLAGATSLTRRTALRADRLAGELDSRWRVLAAALACGDVVVEQAEVIARALAALADDGQVEAHLVAQAERSLVELAGQHDARDLVALGERILTIIAPEVGEERDRRALEAAERRASAATRLSLTDRGDGSVDLRARIPRLVASRLKTYLDAYTSPRTASGPRAGVVDQATGARLSLTRLQGEAFCALLEDLPSEVLPVHGGSATTIVVTISEDALRTGVGEAITADGTRLSVSALRRLACKAGIMPAVIGGRSVLLDLGGRRRRLFTRAQRIALLLRHTTCQASGCDHPAAWSEIHHHLPWSQGGATDLSNALVLCPWHHHRVHDPAYDTDVGPDGRVGFHNRPPHAMAA